MKLCPNCNKEVPNGNTYCNRSCSASYNNKLKPKRKRKGESFNCLTCMKVIERRPCQVKNGHTKYCSVRCMHDHRKAENLKTNTELFNNGELSYRSTLRKFILNRDGYQCQICKLSEWREKPIPLWLDHIDGNASNNTPTNLRLVCLNCDAQGSTFGNKNHGNGRRSLGLKPWA
jgi:hypothetical protein